MAKRVRNLAILRQIGRISGFKRSFTSWNTVSQLSHFLTVFFGDENSTIRDYWQLTD